MSVTEYIFDESSVAWEQTDIQDPNNKGSRVKHLANGLDGGPQASLSIQMQGYKNPPHFHRLPQFQALLEGSVTFPNRPMKPISVHYSDADTPYGPFIVGPNFKLAVLRPQTFLGVPGGMVEMTNIEGRKLRDPFGRDLYGDSESSVWENLAGFSSGVRCKSLIGRNDVPGPRAQIWECSPNLRTQCKSAPFGEYHVLIAGSGRISDRILHPYSMRFVIGLSPAAPLMSGSAGATWLILTFDKPRDGNSNQH